MISRMTRYFFRRRPRPERLPRQFTYAYDIREATTDELRLMRRGYARTPLEARLMLDKAGMTAAEYLKAHPRPTWWERVRAYARSQFVRLVMQIEGSTDQKPSYKINPEDKRLPIRRRYDDRRP